MHIADYYATLCALAGADPYVLTSPRPSAVLTVLARFRCAHVGTKPSRLPREHVLVRNHPA